jgi:hypothetical protein
MAPESEKELVTSEVLTAVEVAMLPFWAVTPCRLACRYQHFGNSIFLRHSGIYLRLYTAPQLRTTTFSLKTLLDKFNFR